MALNPQAKALLDQMAAAGGPKLHEMPVAEARAMGAMLFPTIDQQGLPIGRTEDRAIPGPAGDIRARVYTPIAAGGAPLPALVFFHGGGFVVGGIDVADPLCRSLANEAGARVISVSYRLAPENKFPAAVEDAFAAVKWIEENAIELNIDPNRIAVGGDSAGGNLATVAAIMARDEGLMKLAAQLLIYPVTDFTTELPSRALFAEGYFLERAMMDWFADQYTNAIEEYKDYRISPLMAASLKGLPPAIIVTAGFDPLRDEGKAYADRLAESGVPVIYKNYESLIHGFVNMTAVIDEARAAVREMGAMLKTALG